MLKMNMLLQFSEHRTQVDLYLKDSRDMGMCSSQNRLKYHSNFTVLDNLLIFYCMNLPFSWCGTFVGEAQACRLWYNTLIRKITV